MAEKQAISVAWWPITRPKPYERNARKIPQAAIDKVASSIDEFGWRQPIVCDGQDVIVMGHVRLLAAQQLKLTEVPVHVATNLTTEQIRALRLADNRSHEAATWDLTLLAVEMKDLAAAGVDLASTAFDVCQIDELLASSGEETEAAIRVPDAGLSIPGDIFQLGKHRLICGDARDSAVITALLAGAAPKLMVTDPPYGVSLDMRWRDKEFNKRGPAGQQYMIKDKHNRPGRSAEREGVAEISGDTTVDWSKTYEMVPSLQAAYVWHASYYSADVLAGLQRIGFVYWQHLIWDKGVPSLTRHHYLFQHEPCWYVRKKNAPWHGKFGKQTTIWRANSPRQIMGKKVEAKFDHPTQKPIELMRRPIVNHLKRGEIVFEPFSGSGTTLMAAEITERVCYAIEIDPRFVDLAVKRWQDHTGHAATHQSGKTFAEIVKARAGGLKRKGRAKTSPRA